MSEQSAGAALVALRKREPVTCPICGETSVRITSARYCSSRCQIVAKARRAAERKRAKRQEISENS